MMSLRYFGMSKKGLIMVIAIALILVIIPASAYDYQGVPEQNTDTSLSLSSDSGSDSLDLGGMLDSSGLISLISQILLFFFQLLGIPLT